MSRRAALFVSALVALTASSAEAAAPRALEPAAQGTTRLIVKRVAGLDAADRRDMRADAGTRLARALIVPGFELVEVPDAKAAAALAALNRDPRVRFAERDARVKAHAPDFRAQLWGLARIRAFDAWPLSRGAGVTVAVVDTGVNVTHEDLADRLVTGLDMVDGGTPHDQNGHGTHVSATIAGDDDGQGVVGVAPEARIMPLRVLNASGAAPLSAVVEAFAYAGRRGVRIVNASLGGGVTGQSIDAVMRASPGTLFVAAAGNAGQNTDLSPEFPCVSAAPNVICVGASNQADQRASFSNFGAATVDLFAPGDDILSAWIAPELFLGPAGADGTSFATPHVAGVAALLLARNASLSSVALKNMLLAGADRPQALSGLAVGSGRLNAVGALTATVADADADTIGDVWDVCPSARDPEQGDQDRDRVGDACDDGDGDGVVDLRDACPTVAAPSSSDGCAGTTDTDGDGVADRDDQCPRVAGPVAARGCSSTLDSDGDGVVDARDACPSVKGRKPSGCRRASVLALRARACEDRRRCVAVTVRVSRPAVVRIVLQRRTCDAAGCRWRRALVRKLAVRRAARTARLAGRSRTLARGRYRLRVTAKTPAGRSRIRTTAIRIR